MPNSVTYFDGTPVFVWYVVRCGSKNRHQKDMCSNILDTCSNSNTHSRPNNQQETLYEHENFCFDNEQDIHMSFNIMRMVATTSILIC